MYSSRLLMLLAAGTLAVGSIALQAHAQSAGATASPPPADLSPTQKIDLDVLRSKLAPGTLGLKPNSGAKEGIDLPYGINYSSEAKSIFVPLDQKNEWGVGLNLDVNSSRAVELAPASSPLGLQPKRTPGLMLQKKF
ncbi:MAG: hypothetical protein HY525_05305 [Betaproteobacteria bacterium]|nr:hypothetical protein [Betaproteobacteria bacterium]